MSADRVTEALTAVNLHGWVGAGAAASAAAEARTVIENMPAQVIADWMDDAGRTDELTRALFAASVHADGTPGTVLARFAESRAESARRRNYTAQQEWQTLADQGLTVTDALRLEALEVLAASIVSVDETSVTIRFPSGDLDATREILERLRG